MRSLWNTDVAQQYTTPLAQLQYRSNLLGQDRTVANWGGGNTSVKVPDTLVHKRPFTVLWVKGSGSDLSTITEKGFAGLKLDDVVAVREDETMSDQDMVDYLRSCMIAPDMPRPSIETMMHAFLPFAHIDHTHPDAIISLCCAANGEELAHEIFGDRAIWIPYLRPGFSLAKKEWLAVQGHPQARALLLQNHGLVTWGETSEECYHNTIQTINTVEEFLKTKRNNRKVFGGVAQPTVDEGTAFEVLTEILPVIRGAVNSEGRFHVLKVDREPDILEFVNSRQLQDLSQRGAACPDHLVHTKKRPLIIDVTSSETGTREEIDIKDAVGKYRENYLRYIEIYRTNETPQNAEVDPNPRVVLLPRFGMIGVGTTPSAASISSALYHRAVAVMRGIDGVGEFVSLNDRETYDVEYWPLELYKLSLAPNPAELTGRVAFITGGAGAIGRASAGRLLSLGASVVLADIRKDELATTVEDLANSFDESRVRGVEMDVRSEDSVINAVNAAVLEFGGVDILVSNAGIASSAAFVKTSLDDWDRTMAILATGYFLVTREAVRVMIKQGTGGSVIFVVSKNALVPSKQAVAYNAAKAAELHMARSLAEELGTAHIRVNSVLPDAVLAGSHIWSSAWREERSFAYGIRPDELEEYYRSRTTLGVSVYPEDVAEAVAFFASDRSAKTTGAFITVDGGVPGAYAR